MNNRLAVVWPGGAKWWCCRLLQQTILCGHVDDKPTHCVRYQRVRSFIASLIKAMIAPFVGRQQHIRCVLCLWSMSYRQMHRTRMHRTQWEQYWRTSNMSMAFHPFIYYTNKFIHILFCWSFIWQITMFTTHMPCVDNQHHLFEYTRRTMVCSSVEDYVIWCTRIRWPSCKL